MADTHPCEAGCQFLVPEEQRCLSGIGIVRALGGVRTPVSRVRVVDGRGGIRAAVASVGIGNGIGVVRIVAELAEISAVLGYDIGCVGRIRVASAR